MSQVTLWLVRHGQSIINAGNWTHDPSAAQLTDLGIEQAQGVAAQIQEQPDLIITSPMKRSIDTAQFIVDAWPHVATDIWPIHELIYLSPQRLSSLSMEEKKEQVKIYWQKCDPYSCDGPDAESFAFFLQRVQQFHERLLNQNGFIIVVGHGQFFKAYQLGLLHGFIATPQWMQLFREQETAAPIKNGEIIKIDL